MQLLRDPVPGRAQSLLVIIDSAAGPVQNAMQKINNHQYYIAEFFGHIHAYGERFSEYRRTTSRALQHLWLSKGILPNACPKIIAFPIDKPDKSMILLFWTWAKSTASHSGNYPAKDSAYNDL